MARSIPPWLTDTTNVLSIVTCVLLLSYLLGRLECNKFVRLALAIQLVTAALAFVALATTG